MQNIDFSQIQNLFNTYLDYQVGSLDLRNIVIALGIFLILIIAFRIFRKIIITKIAKLAKHTATDFDDVVVTTFAKVNSHFYSLIAAYIAFQYLNVSNEFIQKIANGVFTVVVVFQLIAFAKNLIGYGVKKAWEKNEQKAQEKQTAINGVKIVANILLWSIGILAILSSFGFDITTLAASLGIGGIAIAFALQNVLGDLFSSFSIYFDSPFKIGDFIVVGNDMGDVKKIGLKTTRIVSLGGEELVISNTELTSTRIKNYKKMQKRRIVFPFGVVYSTTSAQLKKIPKTIEKIIEKEEFADFSRCHFKTFGDFSLNFEVVYFVKSNEYPVYMNTQQNINLGIKAAFEKEKIEMAFPTQTIQLSK